TRVTTWPFSASPQPSAATSDCSASPHRTRSKAAAGHHDATQLRALIPKPGTPDANLFLSEALDPLLRHFDDGEKAALVECAAARNFETACAAGLLAGGPAMQIALTQKLEECRWLVAPHPQDARTRGGHGTSFRIDAQPTSPVIHPWLRLLLLTRLAGLPGAADSWRDTHRTLRDRAEAPSVERHYHSLALEEMDPVVGYLNGLLRDGTVSVGAWLHELYMITAAPMKEPVSLAVPAPQRAIELADRLAPNAYSGDLRDLAVLVAALWMASDPRNRLTGPPIPPDQAAPAELNETIARKLGDLAERLPRLRSPLINEAGMYRH
ncbi:hypothetical protein ACWDOX_39545, partial [Streptomyces sp. NPDC003710]